MKRILAAVSFALAVLGAALPASAGPIAEFEGQLREAYASYRGALFQTNQKNQQATEAALATFIQKWGVIVGQWAKSPPPQYADDVSFERVLAEVASITKAASVEAGTGKLAEAHQTLEKIRDLLSGLRHRNGIVTFSDRMNSYHEKMEVMLDKKYDGFSPSGLGELREDAAVLAHLVHEIAENPLAGSGGNADYDAAFKALKASVENVLAAARAGEAAAAKAALTGLKKPYSQMFLKFG